MTGKELTLCRFQFSNFQSVLGRTVLLYSMVEGCIFKLMSVLGHNFFIHPL